MCIRASFLQEGETGLAINRTSLRAKIAYPKLKVRYMLRQFFRSYFVSARLTGPIGVW